MNSHSRTGLIACAMIAALLAGCHAKPRSDAKIVQPKTDSAALQKATDPCPTRMQDIIGQILSYYAMHGQFPEKLADLKPFADAGMDVTYTCPTSGEPYVYVPGGGISANGIKDRLVLYDASAAHQGERWAIVMEPPLPNQVHMFVIEMNDKLFNAYVPTK